MLINSLNQRKQTVRNTFNILLTWDDRFSYLIEMGKILPPFPESKKNEQTFVPGCQSDAWFLLTSESEKLRIDGDASALITKGMIGLLSFVYSGSSHEELAQEDFTLFHDMQLLDQISPNRANGFSHIIQLVKNYVKH